MSGFKNKDIAVTLKSWIRKSNYRQKHVAEQLRIDPSVLSRQLQGSESIPLERINDIGELVGVPKTERDALKIQALLAMGKTYEYNPKYASMLATAEQVRKRKCFDEKNSNTLNVVHGELSNLPPPNKYCFIDYRQDGIYLELSIPPCYDSKTLNSGNLGSVLHDHVEQLIARLKKIGMKDAAPEDEGV